jgi:hypothetical protein
MFEKIKTLKVIFIGPEVAKVASREEVVIGCCDGCDSAGRERIHGYHPVQWEEFRSSVYYEVPTLLLSVKNKKKNTRLS